jgi:hypothetical protein
MTDEGKAIEYFKWWKSFNVNSQKTIPKDTIAYKAYQTEIGFYDMAIKALEQEPTTKNDLGVDAVSRAEVLKIFDEWFATCDIADKKDSPKIKIKALPKVTSIRPKGHWIESDYGNMITRHRWYCSECGGKHNDPGSGEWREVFDFKYDYCPLCGADMRGVEE